MISGKDILLVGVTQKPYGIRGEILLLFKKVEYAEVDSEYYFLKVDGIPVPFFVEGFTFTTNVSARVKFADVDDEMTASEYVNLEVYLPRESVKEAINSTRADWHFFVGYTVVDQHGETLGTITEVDDSTMNVLFVVHQDEDEFLIPATNDFISAVDENKQIIEMYLPEGLFDE